MLRRLLTLLSAASLVLCIATCMLWVRSHKANDYLGWYEQRWQGWDGECRSWVACSDSGGLSLSAIRRTLRLGPDHPDREWKDRNPERTFVSHDLLEPAGYPHMGQWYQGWEQFGFGYFAGDRNPRTGPMVHDDRFVVVPYWFLGGITGVLPANWLVAFRRRQRAHRWRNRGRCPACGYNLRATPDRCPECGAVPIKSPAPT